MRLDFTMWLDDKPIARNLNLEKSLCKGLPPEESTAEDGSLPEEINLSMWLDVLFTICLERLDVLFTIWLEESTAEDMSLP